MRNHAGDAVLDMIPSTFHKQAQPHPIISFFRNHIVKIPDLSTQHLLPIMGQANSYQSTPFKQGFQASNLRGLKALSIGS